MEITFEQLFATKAKTRQVIHTSDMNEMETNALTKRINDMKDEELQYYNKVRAIYVGIQSGYQIDEIAELLNIPKLEVAQNTETGSLEKWIPEWALNQTEETLKISEAIKRVNNIESDKGSTVAETVVNTYMRLARTHKAAGNISELIYTHKEFEALLTTWDVEPSELINAFSKHVVITPKTITVIF